MVDLYDELVGKYTSPTDAMGMLWIYSPTQDACQWLKQRFIPEANISNSPGGGVDSRYPTNLKKNLDFFGDV